MKNIKIIVATHKKYQMPEDQMYFPVQVGAEGKTKIEEYTQDNTGNNISLKNPYFCELTGLYWAWKNLEAENIGLVHYRRYFTNKKKIPNCINILSIGALEPLSIPSINITEICIRRIFFICCKPLV